MNRVIVDVPNEKMIAFEEALRNLGLERKSEPEYEIPEEHKNFVRNVIATTKPEDYKPWREVMEKIRLKHNFKK
jgi:signal recognition particle subunit SEC65